MKTTEKYAHQVKQTVSATQPDPEQNKTETSTSMPYPRDLVIMRIRHILKNAQDLSSI